MEPSKRKMTTENLWRMVVREIGEDRWMRLLKHLADVEQSTGAVLRRLPRGTLRKGRKNDETCPVLLFAPDQDRHGREFERVNGGNLLYTERSGGDVISQSYEICTEDDVTWWRQLDSPTKGIVISVLGYILLALGRDESIGTFLKETTLR